jgi:hypothetical protein
MASPAAALSAERRGKKPFQRIRSGPAERRGALQKGVNTVALFPRQVLVSGSVEECDIGAANAGLPGEIPIPVTGRFIDDRDDRDLTRFARGAVHHRKIPSAKERGVHSTFGRRASMATCGIAGPFTASESL